MYYLVYSFFYLVSLLPFFILYGIADIGFVVTYYLIGYRREVVMENLRHAFPEKKEKELELISKRF